MGLELCIEEKEQEAQFELAMQEMSRAIEQGHRDSLTFLVSTFPDWVAKELRRRGVLSDAPRFQ